MEVVEDATVVVVVMVVDVVVVKHNLWHSILTPPQAAGRSTAARPRAHSRPSLQGTTRPSRCAHWQPTSGGIYRVIFQLISLRIN